MHNCGLGGATGSTGTLRPLSTFLRTPASARRPSPVLRSTQTTAAVASSSTDESRIPTPQEATPEPVAAPSDAAETPSKPTRRRRRTTTAAVGTTHTSSPTPASSTKPAARTKTYGQPDLQQLFQQPAEPEGPRVRRLPRQQPAVLPAGAEQDASKVLAASKQAAADAKLQAQRQAQLQGMDPSVIAGFQAYASSFEQASKSKQDSSKAEGQGQPHAETAAAAAAAASDDPSQQQQQGSDTDTQQQQQQEQEQQQESRPKAQRSKRDFIELFSTDGRAQQQVVRFSRDIPLLPLPEAAKRATQQVSRLIATRQQQQQLLRQQQQQSPEAAAAAAAADALQQDAGTDISGPKAQQLGLTRIYTPAPPKGAEASEADRQPLQFMSLRQQQQLREEARRAAVLKLRERSVQEYEGTLQTMLTWQPSTAQRFYLPGAPTHFPVAVQRQWHSMDLHSSSSSGSGSGSSNSGQGSAAAAGDEAGAAAVRQLSPEEQQTLEQLSNMMQQQLGQGLPDRAYRGERSLLLSTLSPQAAKERLGRWVGCCGEDYVTQLMTKEPTLLGHEPQVLLSTLEAVSSRLQLSPTESVALVLKQPALIGLDTAELAARIQGLSEAVGCETAAAAKLAGAHSSLIMLHPDYVKERMAALARLLPEAAAKLPRHVVRHPYVLTKSPRAVARQILQMSDALDLSSWATCRLVSGVPSLINVNYDTLRNRLDRLQALTGPVRRWNRELLGMSPPALARCLSASDSHIRRLQQLSDIGAGNLRTLPPINKLLTMPAGWWDVLYADVAAAKEKAAENRAAAVAAAAAAAEEGAAADGGGWPAAAGSTAPGGEGIGTDQSGATVAQMAARAAARAALSRVRGKTASLAGVSVSSHSLSDADDAAADADAAAAADAAADADSAHEDVVAGGASSRGGAGRKAVQAEPKGVLGGDVSWKASLANALAGAAADVQQLPAWASLPAGKPGHTAGRGGQQQQHGKGGKQKRGEARERDAAAESGVEAGSSSRYRRRR